MSMLCYERALLPGAHGLLDHLGTPALLYRHGPQGDLGTAVLDTPIFGIVRRDGLGFAFPIDTDLMCGNSLRQLEITHCFCTCL